MQRRSFLKAGILGAAGGLELLRGTATWQTVEAASSKMLRLNANENPRGPSPQARKAAIRAFDEAGRYPFQKAEALVESLARRHGLEAAQIVLGNGSSEVLQMAVQALAGPGGTVVMAAPTFEAPADCAAAIGAQVETVPLREDFSHNLARMRELAESASDGALVYLCNPNNPTATLTPHEQIQEWLATAHPKTSFILDEAYFDYVENAQRWSAVPLAAKQANLVVTRTFSKVHGMAGLRLGYGVASEETAKRLRAFASDVNTNHLALVAAEASLRDHAFQAESLRLNAAGKDILCKKLRELDLDWIPSQTNFLMHRIKGDVKQHIDRMADAGVRVGRPFPPLLEYNRVSIGLPDEMRRLASILQRFRNQGWV